MKRFVFVGFTSAGNKSEVIVYASTPESAFKRASVMGFARILPRTEEEEN